MKVLILVGSASEGSHSLRLGSEIKSKLESMAIESDLIDLVKYDLPVYKLANELEGAFSDSTQNFLDKSAEADAFVWITPIYHNSYSSMLKNALDWHHSKKFTNKVVGLASNGGGRSAQAVDQLMLVARSQHMIPIPTRICTDKSDYTAEKSISSEDIVARIQAFCEELVAMTKKLQ